ncbi:MAG: hypothetical protein IPH58_02475 [Sphingobacteriales bacterium]|nr:hypothetical protein [Sphingobacteriales bacterium]
MLTPTQMRWVNPKPAMHEAYPGGGSIQVHERMDRDKDNNVLNMGIRIARELNKKVEMTPEIHSYNQQARKLFYPEIPATVHRNPDMRIDGKLADLITPQNWSPEKAQRIGAKFNRQGVEIGIISTKNIDDPIVNIIEGFSNYLDKSSKKGIKEIWIINKTGGISFIKAL